MGFFKKIFKRKKGGTFFGNLLRGVSSTATGGLLGSGAGLAKWEAKQAQLEENTGMNALVKKQQEKIRQLTTPIGNKAKPIVQRAMQSDTANDVNKAFSKAWLKANLWKILSGLLALIGTITVVFSLSKNKKRKRIR